MLKGHRRTVNTYCGANVRCGAVRKVSHILVQIIEFNHHMFIHLKIYHYYIDIQNILGGGGGFKCFLFSTLFWELFQFDYYFSDGLKPPTSI